MTEGDVVARQKATPLRPPPPPPSSSSPSASIVACLSCRSRKIRCERSDDSPDICKRCLITNSPCHFKNHHRGKTAEGRLDLRKVRKRKLTEAEEEQRKRQQQQQQKQKNKQPQYGKQYSDGSPTNDSHIQNHPIASPHTEPNSNLRQRFLPPRSNSSLSDTYNNAPSILSHSSPLTPRPKPSQDVQEGGFMNTEALEDQDAAFQESLRVTRGYSNGSRERFLGESDENDETGGQRDSGIGFNIAPNIRSDAFANEVIRWERLETIFNWHMRRVDPHAGLLDPDLHTASYTREHYPLLFSALTTMSAMARKDPEYPAMARIHEGLDAYATLSGNNCLDRVLAKIAMLIWGIGEGKRPRQGRSRLHRIHQIVTDAMDLSLHLESGGELSKRENDDGDVDEIQWREQASRRRTWIQLCLIYQTYQSDVTQQTDRLLGQKIPTSETFLAECNRTSTTVADYRLAASLDIMAIRCDIIQAARTLQPQTSFHSKSSLVHSTGDDLAELHERLSTLFETWFITDGEDVFPRGKLDILAAQDIHFLAQSTRFYLNQVTWLWSSCVNEHDSSRLSSNIDNSGGKIRSPSHTSPHSVHSVHSTRSQHSALPNTTTTKLTCDETYWFTKSQTSALDILTSLNKMKNEEVTLAQDFVYVSASKVSLWLSRYHMWFSPSFLQDTRSTMSSLLKRCMAATSKRGNTLRCFARLMDAIIQCLPSANTVNTLHSHPLQEGSITGQPPLYASSQEHMHFFRDSHPAPIPTMSTEADAGILRPLRGTAGTNGELVHLNQPWQQQHPPSHHQQQQIDSAGMFPTLDLGNFLDVEDLRHWEEMLGLDLQLGQLPGN